MQCCGSETIIIDPDPIFLSSFGSGSGSFLSCEKYWVQFLFRPYQCKLCLKAFSEIIKAFRTGTLKKNVKD
jgi:hypothetical protein